MAIMAKMSYPVLNIEEFLVKTKQLISLLLLVFHSWVGFLCLLIL